MSSTLIFAIPSKVTYQAPPEPVVEVVEIPTIFKKIAQCESNDRQFNSDGSVVVSPTSDIGRYQINQVHWDRAEDLGIDIYTDKGNLEYALLLYKGSGTDAWYMSEKCWSQV